VSSSLLAYFFGSIFVHTNSHKRELFIRKTGEAYNMTETTHNPIRVKECDIYYACVRAVSGNGLCQYAIFHGVL
jgi:hypothetical protein